MNAFQGKRFCVLGDSICTYEGYTAPSAVFYNAWMQAQTGIVSVNDTWWMQVINGVGGTLGTNDSFAGSTVYGTRLTAGCSDCRTSALGESGAPEVILISMGGNDWGFSVPRKHFTKAYRQMLSKLRTLYPEAEIWCATLLQGQHLDNAFPPFFNAESSRPLSAYNEIIRKEAIASGCHVADLGDGKYDAIDGVHPNKDGMDFIAKCWLNAIQATP